MIMNKRYDIFISYRRDGGEYTARVLRDTLQNQGYRVFFDVEALRAGDFNTMLYSVIEECQDFLLVLSPGALDRCATEGDWVRNEIEHALKHGKNIIPVMMRGFEFPAELPASIEPVRYKNGLQANTELFDAFIAKLQTFFLSKPTMGKRIKGNSALSKMLLVALAVLIIAGGAIGAGYAYRRQRAVFPRSAQEKSVTTEVVYYASTHLTHLDVMAEAVQSALQSASRYLTTGSTNYRTVQNACDIAFQTLTNMDLDAIAPSGDFLSRAGALSRQPFSVADLVAMHDALDQFRDEWLNNNLAYILWITDSNTAMSVENRLHSLEILQNYFGEDMKANAYETNEMLLPITDGSFLSDLKQHTLPSLRHIPLTASSWLSDKDVLVAEEDRCLNNMRESLRELSTIVGNMQVEVEVTVEERMDEYMQAYALSSDEARKLVNAVIAAHGDEQLVDEYMRIAAKRATFLPKAGDNEDTLWVDLAELVNLGLYDDALRCLDAISEQTDKADQDALRCLTAVRLFLNDAEATGIDYGTQVFRWADPSTPHEMFQIGDIIIAFNGEVCHTYEEYAAAKRELSAGAFQVTVLRLSEAGKLERTELNLNTDMAPVYMRTLSSYGYDAM